MNEENAVSESIVWMLADYFNQIAHNLYSPIFLLAALVWLYKTRSYTALIGVFGATLMASSKLCRVMVDEVTSVFLGYSVPDLDQNTLIWFLYIYGLNFGLLILSCALCFRAFTRKSYNNRSQSERF